MTKKDAFKKILAEFPFADISFRMHYVPRWTWGIRDQRHVPSAMELMDKSAYLFNEIVKRPTRGLTSGGLTVRVTEDTVTLIFGKKHDVWHERREKYEEAG